MPVEDSIISALITNKLKDKQENQSKIADLMTIVKTTQQAQKALGEVPSGSGWKSLPVGLIQEGKQFLGMNPALDEYEGTKDFIGTNMARMVGGEKGAMSEGDVQRMLGLWPSSRSSTETRERNMSAIQEILNTALRRHGAGAEDVWQR